MIKNLPPLIPFPHYGSTEYKAIKRNSEKRRCKGKMTAADYTTDRLEEINGILWQIVTGIGQIVTGIDADKANAAEESAAWRELDEQGAAVRDAYRIIFQIQQQRTS